MAIFPCESTPRLPHSGKSTRLKLHPPLGQWLVGCDPRTRTLSLLLLFWGLLPLPDHRFVVGENRLHFLQFSVNLLGEAPVEEGSRTKAREIPFRPFARGAQTFSQRAQGIF